MDINVSDAQGAVPVSIMKLQGDLDGSSYTEVIDKAREVHTGGAQGIVLDLSEVEYISSAGLVALQSIAKLMRGEAADDSAGWDALHSIDRDRESGVKNSLKLLNPHPEVDNVLSMVGLKDYFEIFDDQDKAVASF